MYRLGRKTVHNYKPSLRISMFVSPNTCMISTTTRRESSWIGLDLRRVVATC